MRNKSLGFLNPRVPASSPDAKTYKSEHALRRSLSDGGLRSTTPPPKSPPTPVELRKQAALNSARSNIATPSPTEVERPDSARSLGF